MLLAEFSTHSDLHMAEGMAFEDTEQIECYPETTVLSCDQPQNAESNSATSVGPVDIDASSPISVSNVTAVSRTSGLSYEHAYGIKDSANNHSGSLLPTPQVKGTKKRRKSARRLGVGFIVIC